MNAGTILSIDLIGSDPTVRGGRPIILGTTMRVQDVAIGFIHKGYSVAELLEYYPHLSHAQIHAALAYYYAHKDEIDAQIAAAEALYEQAKAEGRGQRHSPLFR
jgi:uncharacterized protein (DUF433 family)